MRFSRACGSSAPCATGGPTRLHRGVVLLEQGWVVVPTNLKVSVLRNPLLLEQGWVVVPTNLKVSVLRNLLLLEQGWVVVPTNLKVSVLRNLLLLKQDQVVPVDEFGVVDVTEPSFDLGRGRAQDATRF